MRRRASIGVPVSDRLKVRWSLLAAECSQPVKHEVARQAGLVRASTLVQASGRRSKEDQLNTRRLVLPLFLLGAAPLPPRIVSINPCLDAILVRVADPSQIAGISHYSQDPRATSMPLALARRFHATAETAEEVVALRPDRVLTGPHVAPSTVMALERMHVTIERYTVPHTVAESEAQVRAIAAVAGHAERGERLAAAIHAAATPSGRSPLPALIVSGGGLVPGAGTLADDLMTRAGLSNMSARYGLKQWDVLPLERLIAQPPRVVLSAGGDRVTSHPALASLARRIAVVPFPSRLLSCGGPTIVAAMARLRAIRQETAP